MNSANEKDDISFGVETYNKGNDSSTCFEEAKRTVNAIIALRSHPNLLKEVWSNDESKQQQRS